MPPPDDAAWSFIGNEPLDEEERQRPAPPAAAPAPAPSPPPNAGWEFEGAEPISQQQAREAAMLQGVDRTTEILRANGPTPSQPRRRPFRWPQNQPGPGAAPAEPFPTSGMTLPVIRRLERSGDNATSPAGARGRYQIMPDTARQYGFDPNRLMDPAYNTRVAQVILDDLNRRYSGDLDLVAIAYNAGPGIANRLREMSPQQRMQWMRSYVNRSGRRPYVETANYVDRLNQMRQQANPHWLLDAPVIGGQSPRQVGRQIRSFTGGAISEGIGVPIAGAGRETQVYANRTTMAEAQTGYRLDILTGALYRIPAPELAQLRREVATNPPNTAITDFTGPLGARVEAFGERVAPMARSPTESFFYGAGGFTPPLALAFVPGVGPIAAGGAFGSQGSEHTYRDAIASGASPEEAQAAASQSFVLQGLIGSMPVGELGAMLATRYGAPAVGRMLGTAAGEATAGYPGRFAAATVGNAVLGAGIQVAENDVARRHFDPTRPLTANVLESAFMAGIPGGTMQIGFEMAGNAMRHASERRAQRRVAAETPEAAAQPPSPGMAAMEAAIGSIEGGRPGTAPPPLTPEAGAVTVGAAPAGATAAPVPEMAPARPEPTPEPETPGPETRAYSETMPTPEAMEAARAAANAPTAFVPGALADIAAIRSTNPDRTMSQVIDDLGGVEPGEGVPEALANAETGLSPRDMARALQNRGWIDPTLSPDEAVNAMAMGVAAETRHPVADDPVANAIRQRLTEETTDAGITDDMPTEEAAARLAAARANRGPDAEDANARAEEAGVTPGRTSEETIAKAIVKEAMDGTYTRREADADEAIVDEHLTPEEHALLDSDEARRAGISFPPARAGVAQPTPEGSARPEAGDQAPDEGARGRPDREAAGSVASSPNLSRYDAGEITYANLTPDEQKVVSDRLREENIRHVMEAEGVSREEVERRMAAGREMLRGMLNSDDGVTPKFAPRSEPSGNKVFTDEAAEAARRKIREILNPNRRMSAGIDPELFTAGVTLAGWHIEKGARKFAAFAKAMLDDMGEVIRPYLRQWYNAVRDDPSAGEFASEMDPHHLVTDEAIAGINRPRPEVSTAEVSAAVDGYERGDIRFNDLTPEEQVEARGRERAFGAALLDGQDAHWGGMRARVEFRDGRWHTRIRHGNGMEVEFSSGSARDAVSLAYSETDFNTRTPDVQTAIEAIADGLRARADAAEYQPSSMPETSAIPPERKTNDLRPGDPVELTPMTPSPRGMFGTRSVISVSPDGQSITLDGGLVTNPDGIQSPSTPQAPHVPARDELLDAVPPGDVGASPADAAPVADGGPAGLPPAGEGDRSPGDVAGAAAGRPEGSEWEYIGPAGPAPGGRAGVRPDVGLPDPGIAAEPGAPGPDRRPAPRIDANVEGENYRIEPGALAEDRGPKTKARDNLAAIRLAKALKEEGRPATRAEQDILARYIGWGGLRSTFEPHNRDFQDIRAELRDLLTPEEYATAERSSQYAFYTAENIIRSMWSAVRSMGFKGGSVFEPGLGIGHFLGMMPPDVALKSRYQGVEMDHVSASIASLLYPRSGIRRADFTRVPLAENTFDLVIGNPPFADTVIRSDKKYAARRFFIHDYFFAKSIDAVRPGGLLAFVTSAGTMNKLDVSARKYLAQRAEFVGGVRLPSDAFAQNAGTHVTTDILFLRKRDEMLRDVSEPWMETVNRTLKNKYGDDHEGAVNRYFSEHPEQVLGVEGFNDRLHENRYAVQPRDGVNLSDALNEALDRLPKDVMGQPETPTERAEMDFATGRVKEGSFYIKGGKLWQWNGGVGRQVSASGKALDGAINAKEQAIIMDLVPVRDSWREVMNLDVKGENAAEARARLNKTYDAFVRKHGPINKTIRTYHPPTPAQIETARVEARQDAWDRGELWDEGSFDPTELERQNATPSAIAKARAAAREQALARGERWDDGSFDPDSVPERVNERYPNLERFYAHDPEAPNISAMEHYDPDTGTATKSRIFEASTFTREVEPEIRSAQDGVLWSLNKTGRFDPDAIAEKMGLTREEVILQLGDQVYRSPGTADTYVLANEYLSGDIYDKLAEAEEHALHDPEMQRNVEALRAAIPAPLSPDDITMRLGMPWIPAHEYETFVRDHLQIGRLTIRHSDILGRWKAEGYPNGREAASWATEDMDAIQILNDALNRTPTKIYRKMDDGTRIFDQVATEAVLTKVEEMQRAFDEFAHQPERVDALADLYNKALNRNVLRQHDGSYLTTPGIVAGWNWRPHQRRVVARIIAEGNTYMAHAVGAGKTSAMISAGMEMRRLGLVKKPMYAVPNHMLGQFSKEFAEQYPAARIMVADETKFHTGRRRQFVATVAQSDIDAVIITHSSFGKIPISQEFEALLINEELNRIDESLEGLDRSERFTVRKLQSMKEKLEQKLAGFASAGKDETNTFEELGVDFLFVDEAHMFRKLPISSGLNIKGIATDSSQRSWDLLSKIRYLESLNPGRAAVLASGTPITNTMGELYSVSRFLQPEALAKNGITHFDSWAATFAEAVTGLEQTAQGTYKAETRLAAFVNAHELYKMVAQVMDVVTSHQLSEYVVRPRLKGGERQNHLAPRTEFLDLFQQGLADRIQKIKERRGPAQKGDDNFLWVMNDGRAGAIDPRFIDPLAGPDAPSKLNLMLDNVAEIYHRTADHQFFDPGSNYETPSFRGPATQMIFSNMGVNPIGPQNFSADRWIQRRLVDLGVNPSEIAFIKNFKTMEAKRKLFADMNSGKIRILVGTTQRMGTGVNAQRRLYGIHNLDPLWYPADDEQRMGRIIRQGNHNPEIEAHDYSTKGTYDSQMWALMGKKGRFIEQFFRGDPSVRVIEDLGEASAYEQAAAMATTDERILTLTEMKHRLENLRRRRQAYGREQFIMGQRLRSTQLSLPRTIEAIRHAEADVRQRVPTAGDEFVMTVDGKEYRKRAEAAEAMQEHARAIFPTIKPGGSALIGRLGGFDLYIERGLLDSAPRYAFLTNNGRLRGLSGNGPEGVIQSMEARLSRLADDVSYLEGQRLEEENAITSLEGKIGQPFPDEAAIDPLRAEIGMLEKEIADSSKTAEERAAEGKPDFMRSDEDWEYVGSDEDSPWDRLVEGLEGRPVRPGTREDVISTVLSSLERMFPVPEGRPVSRPMEAMRDPNEPRSYVAGAAWREMGPDGVRNVIAWAVNDKNPMAVVRHETVHALRQAGAFRDDEWAALERAAEEGEWIDHYRVAERYPGLPYPKQLEEAIGDFLGERDTWGQPPEGDGSLTRAVGDRIASAMRYLRDALRRLFGLGVTAEEVMRRIETGEIGRRIQGPQQRPAPGPAAPDFARSPGRPRKVVTPVAKPISTVDKILGRGVDNVGAAAGAALRKMFSGRLEVVGTVTRKIVAGANPMTSGGKVEQAAAKDFANARRKVTNAYNAVVREIDRKFTPDRQQEMWEALDEQSVLAQQGIVFPGSNQGLNRLTPEERAFVDGLSRDSTDAFNMARVEGVHDIKKGLPFYAPRMVVRMLGNIAEPLRNRPGGPPGAAGGSVDLRTSSPALRPRKHLTVQETELAAQAIDPNAEVTRNIKTLALATLRMREATLGKALVNEIARLGKVAGLTTVHVGGNPDPSMYFTMPDVPALNVTRAMFQTDPQTGRTVPVERLDGSIVTHRVPIAIHKNFEGPLKAVLDSHLPDPVRWMMNLKSAMTEIVMYNPITHNAVIWGKAIPADPLGVLFFYRYAEGAKLRTDPTVMEEFFDAGGDLIARNYHRQDVTGIAAPTAIKPGDTWYSQVLGGAVGLFDQASGEAVKRAVDRFSDLKNNTLLWERIADLQVGMWAKYRDTAMKDGLDRLTAGRAAAHFANRYAGALPMESMSKWARIIANTLLFSRSFTFTNLGAYKDMFVGLPSDVKAQVERDGGLEMLDRVQGFARRKAIGIFAGDIAIAQFGLWMAAWTANWMYQMLTGDGIIEAAVDAFQEFQSPEENEPGKHDRFLIGYDSQGRAIYGRLPTGKVGEELTHWITQPISTARRKASPLARWLLEIASNDGGYGNPIWDPTDDTPLGQARNMGRIMTRLVSSVLPMGQFDGFDDWRKGIGDDSAPMRALAPFIGVTISRGAPGGPEAGVAYRQQEHYRFQWQEQRPRVIDLLRTGRPEDAAEARRLMNRLNVPPADRRAALAAARRPHLGRRTRQNFLRQATEEERREYNEARERRRHRMEEMREREAASEP